VLRVTASHSGTIGLSSRFKEPACVIVLPTDTVLKLAFMYRRAQLTVDEATSIRLMIRLLFPRRKGLIDEINELSAFLPLSVRAMLKDPPYRERGYTIGFMVGLCDAQLCFSRGMRGPAPRVHPAQTQAAQ
jgi:hypothetical protein